MLTRGARSSLTESLERFCLRPWILRLSRQGPSTVQDTEEPLTTACPTPKPPILCGRRPGNLRTFMTSRRKWETGLDLSAQNHKPFLSA
jgi:hypothetical protein